MIKHNEENKGYSLDDPPSVQNYIKYSDKIKLQSLVKKINYQTNIFEKINQINKYILALKKIEENVVNILPSSSEGEKKIFLPKVIMEEIPEAFLSMYFCDVVSEIETQSRQYAYGLSFVENTNDYIFYDKEGRVKLVFSSLEMFDPKKQEEIIQILKPYFEEWKNEHIFIEDKAVYLPKHFEPVITDTQLRKYVIFDVDILNKEEKLPKNRIEISYDKISFFYDDILQETYMFKHVKTIMPDFEGYKKKIGLISEISNITKTDSQILARRLVARKISELTTKILISLAITNKTVPRIEYFLETTKGKAIIELFSSFILNTIKPYWNSQYHDIIEEIATEMRIEAETKLAIEAVDLVQTFFQQETQSHEMIRVIVESSNEELETKALEQVENFTNNSFQQKIIN
jgi:hypothetical protein